MDYKTLFEKTPPTKLFAMVVIPGIIGMLVSTLYQIIDGAFVGQLLGANAFAAVSLVSPLIFINFSVADLIGVGSAVPIAIKLGEKDEKAASEIFSSACLMIVGTSILLGGTLFVFADGFMRLMGADGELVSLATQYIRVYALCAPFTTIVFAVDNYLRICGKVRYSMIMNILMTVVGATLEFLFLYVFKFGIWGAALATCSGMFVCAILAFLPLIRGKLQLRFAKPKLCREVFVSILSNGCPSFLNNVAGRVTAIIMNVFLLRQGGATAVSAYGVLMYAEGIIQMILYGLCDSLQPAVGYNWGAKNYKRVKAIERRCYVASGALSIIMTFVLILSKEHMVGIFVKAENTALISMSVHALTLFAFAYVTRWISSATQSYMSAVGKAGYASIISISTAFIFPVILIFTLGTTGIEGLWLNYPVTSLLSAVLATVILLRFRKRNSPRNLSATELEQ